VTTLLAEFLAPFEAVSTQKLHFLGFERQQRGNMNSREVPHTTDNRWSNDSYLEMDHKLNSLRSIVCDLLKTNQELRQDLLEARSGVPKDQGSQSSDDLGAKSKL
jgi:hypothetical protein